MAASLLAAAAGIDPCEQNHPFYAVSTRARRKYGCGEDNERSHASGEKPHERHFRAE
jgi:hypothetical protein